MKRWMIPAAALLAAIVLALICLPEPQLPEASQALQEASRGLDECVIEARFQPQERTLTVRQTLTLQNRTGQDLNAAVLRTWPNAFQNYDTSPCTAEEKRVDQFYPDGFSTGFLAMGRAAVNGESVVYRYADAAKTVLHVPVPGGWAQGSELEMELEYAVKLPHMAYRFGEWEGVYAFGNAFAIPAVWENGAFQTDAYAPVGDPFVSDCMNYHVTLTAPRGFACAATAAPQARTEDGETVYTMEAPAVREFALVLSQGYHMAQALEDDVLVTAWAQDASMARQMLRHARSALKVFEGLWGEYPYQSYTLAQIAMPLGGMEYPGLTMITPGEGRELEYLIAHETAHQWWYALVGSDGWDQPWQDEALCEFGVLEYAKKVYGDSERSDLEQRRVESAFRVTVPRGVTPGSPLERFSSMSEYSLVVYSRGAAYACALDRMLPGGLNPFLTEYAQVYAFRRASRAEFEQLLAQVTGEDFAPLARDYLDTSILN